MGAEGAAHGCYITTGGGFTYTVGSFSLILRGGGEDRERGGTQATVNV